MLNRLWPALHRVEFAALNVLRAVAEALVNDDLHPVLSVRPTVPLARLRRRLLKSSPSAPTGLPGSNSAQAGSSLRRGALMRRCVSSGVRKIRAGR